MNTPAPSAAHLGRLPAGQYRLDPELSTVVFTTRHMFGLGSVRGTLKLRAGEFTIGVPATHTRVHAELDATSFDTATPRRDEHVRSPRLLNTAAHPNITFDANSIAPRGETWVALGTVSAHGVAAPVELVIDRCDDAGDHLRFSAGATIDRYAHGITSGKGLAARRLIVRIHAVAHR